MKKIVFVVSFLLLVSSAKTMSGEVSMRDQSFLSKGDYETLNHLQVVNPRLYRLYIDTQITGREKPMPLNDFLEMMNVDQK